MLNQNEFEATLWNDLQKKMTKSGRKWAPGKSIPYRHALLFCESCHTVIGEFDIAYTDLSTNMYCAECVKKYIKTTPIELKEGTITQDCGGSVTLEYTGGFYEKIVVDKICYFSKNGRYIKIKNKRVYI